MTLAGLGLVEGEATEYAEPDEILAGVAEKERRIHTLIEEMQSLISKESGNGEE